MSDPLVSAQWLKDHINAPDVRVIDASWVPPWAGETQTAKYLYNEGHIPEAVFFDIDEIADETSSLPHMMPKVEKFSSRVRRMGLGDGNRLIVYDRGDFMASARVWWMFRYMGHLDIYVLDGGLKAWEAAGGTLEDLPPVTVERHFTARVNSQLYRDYAQIKTAIGKPDRLILDARSEARFEGTAPEPRAGLPSGHMPNSVSMPSSSLIAEDGRLKSAETLKELLAPYLKKPRLIASCGSGVTAPIIALALAQVGRDDVAVYDGSWSEYAAMPDAVIETK